MKIPLLFVTVSVLGCAPPDEPIPLPPTKPPITAEDRVGRTTTPFQRPAYQLPFYSESHTRPTEESREAAFRQVSELMLEKFLDPGYPETLAKMSLPDGRFTAGGQLRDQAIGLPDPAKIDEITIFCDLYDKEFFVSAEGKRIYNPKREVWYALPGDRKLRRATHDKVRWKETPNGRIRTFPGCPSYATAVKDPYEEKKEPPSRFLPRS